MLKDFENRTACKIIRYMFRAIKYGNILEETFIGYESDKKE